MPEEQTGIWESSFQDKQEMWGFEPAKSAFLAKDFFVEKSVKSILIPGIGYGRNAKVFIDAGIQVTGIKFQKQPLNLRLNNLATL